MRPENKSMKRVPAATAPSARRRLLDESGDEDAGDEVHPIDSGTGVSDYYCPIIVPCIKPSTNGMSVMQIIGV